MSGQGQSVLSLLSHELAPSSYGKPRYVYNLSTLGILQVRHCINMYALNEVNITIQLVYSQCNNLCGCVH